MKHVFLKMYQDYCRVNEDIFEMTQEEEENMEEYIERFQYNLQRSKQRNLGKEILKTLLLKGIQAECLEILNLIGTGNVFQLAYDDICELCRRYSRGNFKTGKNSKELLSLSAAKTRVLRSEISNLFDLSKADLQSSVLQNKEKKKEIREARDFPLDSLESCRICDLNNSTDIVPPYQG